MVASPIQTRLEVTKTGTFLIMTTDKPDLPVPSKKNYRHR